MLNLQPSSSTLTFISKFYVLAFAFNVRFPISNVQISYKLRIGWVPKIPSVPRSRKHCRLNTRSNTHFQYSPFVHRKGNLPRSTTRTLSPSGVPPHRTGNTLQRRRRPRHFHHTSNQIRKSNNSKQGIPLKQETAQRALDLQRIARHLRLNPL